MIKNCNSYTSKFATESTRPSLASRYRSYHSSLSSNEKTYDRIDLPESMEIDSEMPIPILLMWYVTKPIGVRELAVEELIRRDLNPKDMEPRAAADATTLLWAARKSDLAERWAQTLLERDISLADGYDQMLMVLSLCYQARGASADDCYDLAISRLERAITHDLKKTYEGPSHALKLLSESRSLPESVAVTLVPLGILFHLSGEFPLAMRCYQLEAACKPNESHPHKKILSMMLTESKYHDNEMFQPAIVMDVAERTEHRYLNDVELKLYALSAYMNNEHYEEIIEVVERVEKLAKELVDKADTTNTALSMQLLDGFFDFYRLNAAFSMDEPEVLRKFEPLVEQYRQMVLKPEDLVHSSTFSPIAVLERARFMARIDRENEILEAAIYHLNGAATTELHNLSLFAHYAMYETQDQEVALKLVDAVLKHAPGHPVFQEFRQDILERK